MITIKDAINQLLPNLIEIAENTYKATKSGVQKKEYVINQLSELLKLKRGTITKYASEQIEKLLSLPTKKEK